MSYLNIKRRLVLSNILALVIPIFLSFLMFFGVMYVVVEIAKNHNGNLSIGHGKTFYESIRKTNQIIGKWPNSIKIDQMKIEVEDFNKKHADEKISLAIYSEKEIVYPTSSLLGKDIADIVLSKEVNSTFVMDNFAVYKVKSGGYTVLLIDRNFNDFDSAVFKNFATLALSGSIIMLLLTILVVLLTNRFLTQFVFKSIITPLDTLVYGVHQIRDGNLDYHIDYTGRDEFASVCEDFNEMAQRLSDSVKVRQKDEANRKELIAGISHDLRTPLTSIKAYVEGIEMGVAANPETQKRYLCTIKNKANDIEHIVNQLFLFSKLDIGEFPFYIEKINMGKELASMVANLSDEYEKKGLTIKLMKNVQNTYVKVDIVQLRNAIINILENSLKYKNKPQGQVKIACEEEGTYVKISLEDNGPGVSNEALDKLFDIFYRSDPSRKNPSKGSGIGLSITMKILEGLGGSIRAENVPEGGLSIIMMLPKYMEHVPNTRITNSMHVGGESNEENIDC